MNAKERLKLKTELESLILVGLSTSLAQGYSKVVYDVDNEESSGMSVMAWDGHTGVVSIVVNICHTEDYVDLTMGHITSQVKTTVASMHVPKKDLLDIAKIVRYALNRIEG